MGSMAQLNVRLSDRGEARLGRLCTLLGMGKTDVVERSLVHLLATLERREKADMVVPSEWGDQEGPDQKAADQKGERAPG